VDLDGTHEGVALLLGVVLDHAGQFVAELDRVRAEPLVVPCAQLDDEVVRHHGAVAVPDRRVVVTLTLQRARDLHGLHLTLEDLGEGPVHQALQPLLKALQHTHRAPPSSGPFFKSFSDTAY
jgi:hypothetical protein